MNTSQRLEGMTDAGQFEFLAIRSLRGMFADCTYLEHLGVNPEGKTIASELDAFGKVPGAYPAKFVMACFTIAANLTSKWFFDHSAGTRQKSSASDDGDLVKVARRTKAIRAAHPGAECTAYICTNRSISQELLERVSQFGLEHDITIIPVGQSMLRDYLDLKPDGQYLRRQYFGESQDLLSRDLLVELGRQTLHGYVAELLNVPADGLVSTPLTDLIADNALGAKTTTLVVIGPSGFGKSAACVRVLSRHLDSGGIGLRVRGEVLAKAASLQDSLRSTLTDYSPSLGPDCGQRALKLANQGERLLLIVDDINRSPSPVEVLRLIASWTRPDESNHEESRLDPQLSLVVPIWDSVWDVLLGNRQHVPWIGSVRAVPWSANETVQFLSTRCAGIEANLAKLVFARVAERIAGDPMLAGLYAALFASSTGDPVDLADDVLTSYVEQSARIASNNEVPAGQIVRGIKALVRAMLGHRTLSNEWGTARQWIGHDECRAVEAACKIGALCQFVGEPGREAILFRHDRIFEHFAVIVFCDYLSDLDDEGIDLISDPFYSEYVGRAVAMGSQKVEVEFLMSLAPLALVAALDSTIHDPLLATGLVTRVRIWLATKAEEGSALQQAHWFAWLRLLSASSPAVLDVTEACPRHPILLLARLANGDARAGIEALSGSFGFRLGATNKQLEDAVMRAVLVYRPLMVQACINVLSGPHCEEDFHSSCAIAGFLEEPCLTSIICSAWERAPWRESSLDMAIWACLRCDGQDLHNSLEILLGEWATLPEEVVEDNFRHSPRQEIARTLSFAARYGISDQAVATLTALSERLPELQFHVAFTLERLHTAPAVRYVARQAARSAHDNRYGLWLGELRRRWRGEDFDGAGLPNPLIGQILEAAESQNSEPWLSQGVRSLWMDVTRDAGRLQAVSPNDPLLRRALRRRLQLGDRSVVGVALGQTEKFEWNEFRRVLGQDLLVAVDMELTSLSVISLPDAGHRYDSLAELLISADVADVAILLLKHWVSVSRSHPFLYIAIFSGNQELLRCVADEVSRQEEPREVFKEFQYYFEFTGNDLKKRLKPNDFDALAPYVRYLPLHCLDWVGRAARSVGLRGWCEAHVRPAIDRYPRELFRDEVEKNYAKRLAEMDVPTDHELSEQLNEIEVESDFRLRLHIWCELFERRVDPPDRLASTLRKWLRDEPSIQRLRIVGDALAQCGRRSDLTILEQEVGISAVPEAVEVIKKARLAVCRRTLN